MTLNLQNSALPRYSMTLPVSGINVKFRPFVVKEEKVLLVALQSKDINQTNEAMRNVVMACTENAIDTKKLCAADSEYAFLQIRSKSIGEEVKPQVKCSNCEHSTNIKIKLDEITISEANKPKADPNIVINDTVSLVMRYPSIHDFDYNKDEVEIAFELAKQCIEAVIVDEQVHQKKDIDPKHLSEFVDNLLPDQFAKIMDFMQTVPQLRYSFKYTCPNCSTPVNVELDTVSDFFQ